MFISKCQNKKLLGGRVLVDFIFVLASLGFCFFLVLAIVAFFKRNGKVKKNLIWAVSLFVVFLVLGNFVETPGKEAKAIEEAKVKEEAEAKAKVEEEARKGY